MSVLIINPPATFAIGSAVGSGTSGSILFVDSSLNLAQDNSNLFWDDANNRIGIGTNTPGYKVEIVTSTPTGDEYSIVSRDNTYNRKIGFFWGSSGAEGGVKADGQLQFASGGIIAFRPQNNAYGMSLTSNGNDMEIWNQIGTMIFKSLTTTYVPLTARGAASQSANLQEWQDSSFNILASIDPNGKLARYRNVSTVGWGVPAIYGSGRSTAQTAAVATVATYTVGGADGSFIVSSNVNVTTSTSHTIAVQVDYTDETNTARTLTLSFSQLTGAIINSITNVTGAGPYEGVPNHIRCKASTAITIKTTGTFLTVTYNVEGVIQQTQ